jgi:hypothetical protein
LNAPQAALSRVENCAQMTGAISGLSWSTLMKNSLKSLPSKRKALSILMIRG